MSLGGNNYVTAGNFLWRISQYFFHRFGEQSVVLPMRQTGYRDDSGHLPFFDDLRLHRENLFIQLIQRSISDVQEQIINSLTDRLNQVNPVLPD